LRINHSTKTHLKTSTSDTLTSLDIWQRLTKMKSLALMPTVSEPLLPVWACTHPWAPHILATPSKILCCTSHLAPLRAAESTDTVSPETNLRLDNQQLQLLLSLAHPRLASVCLTHSPAKPLHTHPQSGQLVICTERGFASDSMSKQTQSQSNAWTTSVPNSRACYQPIYWLNLIKASHPPITLLKAFQYLLEPRQCAVELARSQIGTANSIARRMKTLWHSRLRRAGGWNYLRIATWTYTNKTYCKQLTNWMRRS